MRLLWYGAAARHLGLLAATMRRWYDACGHFEKAWRSTRDERAAVRRAHAGELCLDASTSAPLPAHREKARALLALGERY
jgi:hypothetical protein